MILHLYFARRFAMAFLMLIAVFFALIFLVDMLEQVRKFGGQDAVGFPEILQLSILNTPETMNQIMPLIMILATVWLFLSLARSSEMVVTRASGRSALRALFAPVVVAFVIGGLAVSTLNPIVAATSNRYETLSETYRSGSVSALSVDGGGLWMRQGSETGQTVIHARRANEDASAFFDVSFLAYTPEGGPTRRIEAESAALTEGAWRLTNAKVWPLTRGINPEANAVSHAALTVKTTLTVERIRDGLGTPAGISIYDLPAFINQLDQAGFSTRRHQVWLQSELARPFFLVAMVLVAASFTMRHTRFGGTGVAVLSAVLLGFTLYFIRNFAQILGENGQIPVTLAAWAPPAAAILLAMGLLLHAEDG